MRTAKLRSNEWGDAHSTSKSFQRQKPVFKISEDFFNGLFTNFESVDLPSLSRGQSWSDRSIVLSSCHYLIYRSSKILSSSLLLQNPSIILLSMKLRRSNRSMLCWWIFLAPKPAELCAQFFSCHWKTSCESEHPEEAKCQLILDFCFWYTDQNPLSECFLRYRFTKCFFIFHCP